MKSDYHTYLVLLEILSLELKLAILVLGPEGGKMANFNSTFCFVVLPTWGLFHWLSIHYGKDDPAVKSDY